jgi:DNA repair protein RecO (recombination protein O)
MSAEKSLALVLRVVEFSETSAVVTLFTEDFGKLTALAKGARRRKSPFESALDLLAICRVVFLHKHSDTLDLLTEAKLERRFRAAARDLRALYAGYYVLELLDQLTDRHDPAPELFRAAVRTIVGLDEGHSVRMCAMWWECQVLRLQGHFPELESCVECARPLAGTSSRVFGLLAGGVLCDRCKQGQRHLIRLSSESIALLQQIAAAPSPLELSAMERPATETSQAATSWLHARSASAVDPWAPRIGGELRGMMNQYLAHLIGRRPRMHEYLLTVLT